MIVNPLRLFRRHKRAERQALEEAQHLRRRYGDAAIAAAREKLRRPELTRWGRRVLKRTIEILRREV